MKKVFLSTVLASLLAGTLGYFAFTFSDDTAIQVGAAISFAILIPQLVAMWAFLSSLGIFKKKLKIAYYTITVAILFLSLNQLQLPVAYSVTIDPVALGWFIAGTMLGGSLLMYLGMYKFALVLGLRVRPWGSFICTLALSLGLAVAASFIPHVEFPLEERIVNGVFGMYMAGGGFATAAALLAWNIRKKLTPSYKPAMGWLTAGLTVLAFSSFHETMVRLAPFLSGEGFAWYSGYGVSLWPLFAVAILLLAASLLFRRLKQNFAELSESASYLDVVSYAAQLVSDPTAVDIILDKVREITVTHASSAHLSDADKATLVKVYRQLEEYLIEKEPLLHITREDLQARLPKHFLEELNRTTGQTRV